MEIWPASYLFDFVSGMYKSDIIAQSSFRPPYFPVGLVPGATKPFGGGQAG